jgi:hypothetical protein
MPNSMSLKEYSTYGTYGKQVGTYNMPENADGTIP